jgi:hypothetical protein
LTALLKKAVLLRTLPSELFGEAPRGQHGTMWAQKRTGLEQQAFDGLAQQVGGNWLVLFILPYVLTTAIQVGA